MVLITFEQYHPAIVLGFFIAVILLTLMANIPAWTAVSAFCSGALYIWLRRRNALKTIGALFFAFVLLSVLNPLLNTLGDTVLFTYMNGRQFSAEALLFGIQTSGVFVSVLLWFACLNQLVPADKLTSLFAGITPSVALMIATSLRFVSFYTQRAKEISQARTAAGIASDEAPLRVRAEEGADVLHTLVSTALESGVIAADSMRSRGYGFARRTNIYARGFAARDVVALLVSVLFLGMAVFGLLCGNVSVQYFPCFVFEHWNAFGTVGFASFGIFASLPLIIGMQESLLWRRSISRI